MLHTKGQAIDFIEKCFGKSVLSNGGLNASVVCPKCAEREDNLQKRKLVIRTSDFLTHCWVCGYRSSNLTNLLSDYHPYLLEEYHEKFNIKQPYKRCTVVDVSELFEEQSSEPNTLQVQLPVGFTLLANNLGKNIKHVDDAWHYLKNRGVTESELWYWKCVWW